jgi:hypothetical protein
VRKLGFVVDIVVDLDKVTTILALKCYTIVKKVQGFLGRVGYYKRFVEGYAKIVVPQIEFLKEKHLLHWTN